MVSFFDVNYKLIAIQFFDFGDTFIFLKQFLELVSDFNKITHDLTLKLVFPLLVSFVKICDHQLAETLELINWLGLESRLLSRCLRCILVFERNWLAWVWLSSSNGVDTDRAIAASCVDVGA